MINKIEFDKLKAEEEKAYLAQKKVYHEYKRARDCANDLYDERGETIKARNSTREIMLEEYDKLDSRNEHYRTVWSDYERLQAEKKAQIDELVKKAQDENRMMQDCFDMVVLDKRSRNSSRSQKYSREGARHKDKRNSLNKKVKKLRQEIDRARERAKQSAPKTDSSDYQRAKAAFQRAKARDEAAKAEFDKAVVERNLLKAEHETLKAKYLRLKEEIQNELNAYYQELTSDKALKLLSREDGSGKTDVYFGGFRNTGDGLGHGHAVIESDGNVSFIRDAKSGVILSITNYEEEDE
ncbi:hypothetical protein J5491_01155 [Candidatus Saccharibacteria bacterium]|nr:hypothetical protein [Candidatus Saccharibacteria bacterium]